MYPRIPFQAHVYYCIYRVANDVILVFNALREKCWTVCLLTTSESRATIWPVKYIKAPIQVFLNIGPKRQ